MKRLFETEMKRRHAADCKGSLACRSGDKPSCWKSRGCVSLSGSHTRSKCDWEGEKVLQLLASPKLSASVTDCYMEASLGSYSSKEHSSKHYPWLVLSPLIGATSRALPTFRRWHLETQEKLIRQLSKLWGNKSPRTMVDLGCHAGHGPFKNMSDILIWLRYFNSSGSLVLGVDIFEDFALDVQHRLDRLLPYAQMEGLQRITLHRRISKDDGLKINQKHIAMQWVDCCSGKGCGWEGREAAGHHDHMCRITRQRLGLRPVTSALPLPNGSYPHESLRAMMDDLSKPAHSWSPVKYEVLTMRADTMWSNLLKRRRIDFLKIDIDQVVGGYAIS